MYTFAVGCAGNDWLVFDAEATIEEQFIRQVRIITVLYLVTIWFLLIVTGLE